MSKSIKRYNDDDEFGNSARNSTEHRHHLREKKLRSALRSKNIDALYEITEEEY